MKRHATRSRLELRCRRHAVAPSVAIRVWLRGGQLTEPQPGLALATGRLLTEGTRSRSWDRIVRESEALGMDVSGFGAPECIGLAIDALASDWRAAVELAAELVLDAVFPEDRCLWVREQTLAEVESLAEQPEVLAGWAFLRQLYGKHPWGRPLQGTREGLDRVGPSTCARVHRRGLEAGVIVSVAGDVDEDRVEGLVRERFADQDRGSESEPAPETRPPSSAGERRQEVEVPDGEQAQVLAGHLTVPLTHPDFVALEVASVILGSGPGLAGRIPERLREREGLAYAASAAAAAGAGSQPGRLVVHAGTAPERVDALLEAVREELERFVADGVGREEFEDARRYLLGRDPFRRETARQLAVLQAQSSLYGLPVDETAWLVESLRSLDRASFEAAVRRWLDPEALLVTVGRPAAGPAR